MSFASDLQAYADSIDRTLDQTYRAVVIELFTSTIMDTPVLDGYLRGAWVLSEGEPDLKPMKRADKTGSIATGVVRNYSGKVGGSVYLTNSLPYAYRVEFEGWSHTKAPEGMMRKNFARVQGIVRKAAQEARA